MTVAETKTQPEHADIDGMLKQARELLQDGRIEASADLARKLLRASPDNDEALYILAV